VVRICAVHRDDQAYQTVSQQRILLLSGSGFPVAESDCQQNSGCS
jgi:hypothetical protein